MNDFEALLANIEERKAALEEARKKHFKMMAAIREEGEEEQSLSGFGVEGPGQGVGDEASQAEVDRALENEAFLHCLANQLAEVYEEWPTIPEWALAKNKFPSYYS